MCSYIIQPKALFFCYNVPLSNAKNSSRRKLKLFAKNFEFLREQFFCCFSRISKLLYHPSVTGPEGSVPSAFFFSFFPFFSFFSFGATCSYVTSFSVKYFAEARNFITGFSMCCCARNCSIVSTALLLSND